MALLDEYAITPDVFDMSFYSSGEIADVQLKYLKEVILNEGLVRNLRSDKCSWISTFQSYDRPWHKKGIELLKKIIVQNRLSSFDAVLPHDPVEDEDWCHEAMASHQKMALRGIVTTSNVARSFKDKTLVSEISKLYSARWWQTRSPSIRLRRVYEDYQTNLKVVLQSAKSIMFIDPHLDPSKPRYDAFCNLLSMIPLHKSSPLLEIHRVCYVGAGKNRSFPEWKNRFKDRLSPMLMDLDHSIDVFIWDDFHDRYLISNLVGISLPNGFDTSRATANMTTWTRLGRSDRDHVQREFHPATNTHKLRDKFRIP